MNFSDALTKLKSGRIITRKSWLAGRTVRIINNPQTGHDAIYSFAPGWEPAKLILSDADLLAEDWQVIDSRGAAHDHYN